MTTARAAFAALSVLLAPGGSHAAPSALARGPVIIAYVFPRDAVIDPGAIAADELTHVNYAFANIAEGRVVEGFAHDAENFRVLARLRRAHPHLKILVSVGGWTWSGAFSDAALTASSRRRFVRSAVDFVRRHDLDGFDVDWEYPVALDRAGAARRRHYLLTLAAGASSEFLAHTEMEKVQASVDFVNLMTYDFREAESEPVAGHHANLFAHPAAPFQSSADRAVRDYLAAGVPPGKLVLGVPFYGRAWAQVDSDDAAGGLYRPGRPLVERLDTSYPSLAALAASGAFERRWDATSQAPYLWSRERKIFVTYDDPESLRAKSRYILEHGLAGAMFWEYYADPTGTLRGVLFSELRGRPPAR